MVAVLGECCLASDLERRDSEAGKSGPEASRSPSPPFRRGARNTGHPTDGWLPRGLPQARAPRQAGAGGPDFPRQRIGSRGAAFPEHDELRSFGVRQFRPLPDFPPTRHKGSLPYTDAALTSPARGASCSYQHRGWHRLARRSGAEEPRRREAGESRAGDAGVDRRRQKAYDVNCASCHGNLAQGAEKAGIVISIIQEQGGKQPPDLTDDKWDHGSTDGEIYTVIKKGVPPTMMAGWDGRIPDTEIWSIVNYLRALAAKHECRGRADACGAGCAAADTGAGGLRPDADHRRARRREHTRSAGAREFPARRAGRPPLLRERPQRAALHPRQGDASGSRPISISTASPGGPVCSRGSPSSATSRPASSTSSSIPTTRATASSTRSIWRIRRSRRPPSRSAGVVPGLDLSGYRTTPAIVTPMAPGAQITREAVMIEWTDRNIANTTFEGTARELLRVQLAIADSSARRDDLQPDRPARRSGLARHVCRLRRRGHGEQRDIRRLNPQRLDKLGGKILRIVPDLREHTATSTVSDNGRYRDPERQPVRRGGRCAQGDLGARACAIPIG